MHTLLALVLTAAAAVVIARPGPAVTTKSQDGSPELMVPTRKYLKDYLLPHFLAPHYFAIDDVRRHQIVPSHRQEPLPATVWLKQEIDRLTRMQQRAHAGEVFKPNFRLMPELPVVDSLIKRMLVPHKLRDRIRPYDNYQPWAERNPVPQQYHETTEMSKHVPVIEDHKKEFALTPLDKGYFGPTERANSSVKMMTEGLHEGGGQHEVFGGEAQSSIDLAMVPEPPRQIRQNPNLSRTKSLIADNLDKLRVGFGHDELGATHNILVQEAGASDSTESFYGVAVISAIGAAVIMALLGFAFAWYSMAKRAKAAADVDYPAYGVTGPTIDTSGDRKLAHSAHMYHYQHQKQQIIAMEKNGMERSGSFSDPESEDENEEGDYTVYECPGFATTGDIEVKNPLFNEEPTSATPGKCEVVKPQPKD